VDLAIEPPCPEKSRVENVETVRGREDDDRGGARVEAVHFGEKLKE